MHDLARRGGRADRPAAPPPPVLRRRPPLPVTLIVDDLRVTETDHLCEVSARVRRAGPEQLRLWWRFPRDLAPARADGSPFLAGALVWCMRHGEDLEVDAPVSARLLAHVEEIVAVYRSLFPARMRPIRVRAQTGAPPPPVPVTGCYFSRGVDSWYAILRALEEDPQSPPLTHLVYSPGFLSRSDSATSVRGTTDRNRDAAERTGLRFVEVDSNLKWDFGGAQIASTALALGFERMLLPSGAMHGEIVPAVTHPVLDHRFSTERTEVAHYGDASRLDKVARVARSTAALATLYVCQADDPASGLNCGRCEKCVRTMIELHLVGALSRAPTFPPLLEPGRVAGVRRRLGRRQQWVDALYALGDDPRDGELAAAIRLVIAHSDLTRAVDALDELAADPHLRRLHRRLPRAVRRARRMGRAATVFVDGSAPSVLGAIPARLRQRAAASALARRLLERPAPLALPRPGEVTGSPPGPVEGARP